MGCNHGENPLMKAKIDKMNETKKLIEIVEKREKRKRVDNPKEKSKHPEIRKPDDNEDDQTITTIDLIDKSILWFKDDSKIKPRIPEPATV